MIIKKGGFMDDKKISKYIHYAERSLLIFIAFATVFATAQEIIVLVDNKRVLLEDLLLLFIYTEVLGMVAAFYRSNRIPVTLPLFIAMTALARLIILQGKEPSDLLYEAGAIVLVALACLIIRIRPPENFRANIEE
jgi:protein PsiE|tara:strand:+ start:63 stop:470 length:408 start_codon:yes stop_codon:yes gene_type:complete